MCGQGGVGCGGTEWGGEDGWCVSEWDGVWGLRGWVGWEGQGGV